MRTALHGGLQSHSFFKNRRLLQLVLGFPGKNWNFLFAFLLYFIINLISLTLMRRKWFISEASPFMGHVSEAVAGRPGEGRWDKSRAVSSLWSSVWTLCSKLYASRPPWVSRLKCFLKVHLKLSMLLEVWLPPVKCIVSGKVLIDLIESESLCSLSNSVGQRWEGGHEF